VSGINIPGYKIIKTLGVGGQATVYLAIQSGFDREVALKVMSPALAADPSFGERFIREAKIVAKLRHPGIVTVYDVGEHDGFYYLAMEYLPETDLRQRITSGMKAKDALTVIEQVARALHYAHKQGYIHRDVKSENILFNDHNEAVLTDFGIAKASNSSTQMTQQGKLIGTPQYMSPEQCRGRTLDGRADIYSLGIIFYEMLTQQVPYDGEDSVAVCLQHVTKPIPQLSARQQHYQWLLNKMLAKKAEDRFADAQQLAEEVARFLAGDISLSQTAQNNTTTQVDGSSIRAQREDSYDNIFDDTPLQAERRTFDDQAEEKSRKPWVALILLIGLGGGAYVSQDLWLPKLEHWYAQLSDKPEGTIPNTASTSPGTSQQASQKDPQKNVQAHSTGEGAEVSQDSASEELVARKAQIARLIAEADSLVPLPQLTPEQAALLLQSYSRVLALDSQHAKALAGREEALVRTYELALQAINEDQPERFNQFQNAIASVAPNHSYLAELQARWNQYLQQQDVASEQQQQRQQINTLLTAANEAFERGDWVKPKDDNALLGYQKVLAIDAQNESARKGIQKIIDGSVSNAQSALLNQQLNVAKTNIETVASIDPELPALADLREQYSIIEKKVIAARQQAAKEQAAREKRLAREKMLADPLVQLKIQSKLDAARSAYAEQRLVAPEGENALAKYREVLDIDSQHAEALDGVKLVQDKLLELTRTALQERNKAQALEWLAKLRAFFPDNAEIPVLVQQIEELDLELIPEQGEANQTVPTVSFDSGANDERAYVLTLMN